MRILFSSSPGVGHLLPLLSVAKSASSRGHETIVGCGESLRALVERAELAHVALGPATLDEVRAAIPGIELLTGRDRATVMYRDAFGGTIASAIADDVLRLETTWRPDVIVHEDMELGSWIAAERLGIPHVTIQATAWRPWQRPLLEQSLNAIRRRHGLPPDPDLAGHLGRLWFTTRPASMRDPAASLPVGFRELRPEPEDRAGLRDGEPTSWPQPAGGRRRVVVTLGTVNAYRLDLLRPITEGAAAHPVEVVVGLGADPETLGAVPDNVLVERFVPMSDVLPSSSALIHHGGSGTSLAAFAAGRPTVVVPIAADQFDNAEAAARTGAGIVLDATTLTPDVVEAAVGRILSEPSFGKRAAAVGTEIAAMPGPEEALDAIEGLL